MGKDEISQAASDGDLESLRSAMKVPGARPDGKKAQNALVCAAEADKVDALRILLDWGVPVDSVDDSRRRALHVAAAKGAVEVCEELLKRDADFKAGDSEGNTPLALAVSLKQLPVCKALLKVGAKLPAGLTCKGLAQVVGEVQIEILVGELKGYAAAPSVTDDLLAADTVVWQAQSEHMRLLVLKEEKKAGGVVMDLELQLNSEMEVYLSVKNSEETLAKELQELRLNLTTVETASSMQKQQLDAAESAAREATSLEETGDVEYKAMLAELTKCQSEKETADKLIVEKERARDEDLAMAKVLQEEAAAMKSENADVSEQLRDESALLRGWERDREAAQLLAKQAHELLGIPTSPPAGASRPSLIQQSM